LFQPVATTVVAFRKEPDTVSPYSLVNVSEQPFCVMLVGWPCVPKRADASYQLPERSAQPDAEEPAVPPPEERLHAVLLAQLMYV